MDLATQASCQYEREIPGIRSIYIQWMTNFDNVIVAYLTFLLLEMVIFTPFKTLASLGLLIMLRKCSGSTVTMHVVKIVSNLPIIL